MLYRTPDLSVLVGLPESVIHRWVDKGVVSPTIQSRGGRSNANQYSLAQASAFAVLGPIHQSVRSCTPEFALSVFERFEGLTDLDAISNTVEMFCKQCPHETDEIRERFDAVMRKQRVHR